MSESTLDNIKLRSEEVQEILTRVPHWMIRYGNFLFLSLILLMLIISWFVKYPDVIESEAIITTEVPPHKEYAKTTGLLQELLVENNQFVEANQPLAIIQNSANFEDVFLLQSIIDTIKLNNESIYFPIEKIPVIFLGQIEAEYAIFENNYMQYHLNKKLEPFSNEAIANAHSIAELNNRLHNMQSQRKISEEGLVLKKKELDRNKTLYEEGVISAQDYENNQLEYSQADRDLKNFESSISLIRESISNAQKISKGTEINRIKEEMVLLKNVIQSYNQLKRAIKDWRNRYVMESRMNGRVTFLSVWNANQAVDYGELVFTIIPQENSSFIAKLKTPAKNSGKVKVGQMVNIKLDNYIDSEFGVLNGYVENISLIPDKENFYLVDVKLPEKLITSYKKEIEFRQEMSGIAEIITEDLRLIERFFYQFRQVLQ